MAGPLVLSLFPGIGLLDCAFEEEGFTVVRGPDVLWGGDVRRFHPPGGVFAGVIGGPPCQSFSRLVHLVRAQGREPRFGNLIPEYERCVSEAAPAWFLMENVPAAPLASVPGYVVRDLIYNNRWTGEEQNRVRRFCFGTPDGRALHPDVAALESSRRFTAVLGDNRETPVKIGGNGKVKASVISGNGFGSGSDYYQRQSRQAVTAAHGYQRESYAAVTSSDGAGKVKQVRYTLAEACRLQGLPEDFLADAPFTAEGKLKAVANGVPLPMGRAIARAVVRAMGYELAGAA